ncbi:MAG: ankyrin repeat domain-containing protein [Acidobacteria bacterium]|nr:ankyrin repeat domain-containing protein [Acidobacteriota bacterium]
MDKIQLKSETLPTRCEICHKSDCFDAKINFCSRCAGVPTTVPSRYNNSTDFLDAVNDARFVKTFGIISLVGLIFVGIGKAIGVGVGLAVLWYSKNNYYRILGTFVAALSFVLTPVVSFWVLSTAIVVKGYDILKVLREQRKDDPDWQITRKRVLTGMITSSIGFFLSVSILGVMVLREVMLRNYSYLQNENNYTFTDPKTEKLSLIQATIRNERVKVANILVDNPETINDRDGSGTSATIYAAQLGYIEILTLLCEAGADVNAQDANGLSALMYATMSGYKEAVEVLLLWGADPELKNNVGYKALDYAKKKNNSDIIELLTLKTQKTTK